MSCSKNQLDFIPATGGNIDGVYDAITDTNLNGVSSGTCRSIGSTLATASGVEHTFLMVICPEVVDFGGAAGIAYLNGFQSWYLNNYGSSPFVQSHGKPFTIKMLQSARKYR